MEQPRDTIIRFFRNLSTIHLKGLYIIFGKVTKKF